MSECTSVSWSNLSPHILLKIFWSCLEFDEGVKYVLRCGQACKSWNKMTEDSLVWKNLNLSYLVKNRKKTNDNTLRKILKEPRFSKVKKLDLSDWEITDKGLVLVSKKLKSLESLHLCEVENDFEVSKVTKKSLLPIMKNCCIKELDLQYVNVRAQTVQNMISVKPLILTSLALTSNPSVDNATFNMIIMECHELVSLDVSKTSIFRIDVKKFQIGCPKLNKICLVNVPIISFENVANSPGFSELTELDIQREVGSNGVSELVLKQMLHSSPYLRILNISNCDISSFGWVAQVPLENLKELYMEELSVDQEAVVQLFTKVRRIETLDISSLEINDIDVALETITKYCDGITKIFLEHTNVTVIGVHHLMMKYANLKSIGLFGCPKIPRVLMDSFDESQMDQVRQMLQNCRV